MRMYLLIGSPKLRPMVRFMNRIHPSISFLNEMRHFLSQIQRPDSDNNVPGLTPSYKKSSMVSSNDLSAHI